MIDEKVGDGDGAAPGDTVTVAYVGTLASTGVQFDAAKKFTFSLGNGDVIKGCAPPPSSPSSRGAAVICARARATRSARTRGGGAAGATRRPRRAVHPALVSHW